MIFVAVVDWKEKSCIGAYRLDEYRLYPDFHRDISGDVEELIRGIQPAILGKNSIEFCKFSLSTYMGVMEQAQELARSSAYQILKAEFPDLTYEKWTEFVKQNLSINRLNI